MRLAIMGASLACLALAGCAAGPRVPRYSERLEREVRNTANPSTVVASEIAYARAAREDGQWSAARDTAADGAVVHQPGGPIAAASLFSGRSDPAVPSQWTPLAIWSSCDGETAVAQGKYADPDGTWGFYVRVWERQRDYGYRWTYELRGTDAALTARENAAAVPQRDEPGLIVVQAIPMIQGEVAECASTATGTATATGKPPAPPATTGTQTLSRDGTLAWSWTQQANGRRTLVVHDRQGGQWREGMVFTVAADGTFVR